MKTVAEEELTICTVSYHNNRHLHLNRQLATTINQGQVPPWIVVENSPLDAQDRVQSSDGFIVHDGTAHDPQRPKPGSYHHGLGLNQAIRLVETRFALVLDPDFYIVRLGWVTDVLRHMQENGLAFLGAPYHPRWRGKWRYFPCVPCLFIDGAQVNFDDLDFRPGSDSIPAGDSPGYVGHRSTRLRRNLLLRSPWPLRQALRDRLSLRINPDTGYSIYSAFRHLEQHECLVPTLERVFERWAHKSSPRRAVARLVDALVGEPFSMVPRRKGYFSTAGFRSFGYFDAAGEGWEEFLWKRAPFGFHLHGKHRDRETEVQRATAAVATVTDHLGLHQDVQRLHTR